MTTVLCAIFFFSGASALIFEMLWFQLSGLTFGNSVWASALVLCSFMGGLALGNGLAAFLGQRTKFPIRFYAFLEVVIALSGLSLVLMFPKLTQLLVPIFSCFIDQPLMLNLLRSIAAFILMMIPATAMGSTLPILVKALYADRPNFGRVLGVLYGWNTIGAMSGIIACEMLFIKWFGLKGTGILAAALNLFAAAMAVQLSNRYQKAYPILAGEEESYGLSIISFRVMSLLSGSFLSGFTLLALEVIWFRFMLLFFNSHSRNFAVMLAMVLLGISLGGLFASRLFKLRLEAHRFLVPILLINGIILVGLYTHFTLPLAVVSRYRVDALILLASFFLVFPVSFCSGIVFTMLGKALYVEVKDETKAAGLLTLANTTGGMLGSLAGLFLIPSIGIEKSVFLFAAVYGLIAVLVFNWRQLRQSWGKVSLHLLPGGLLLIALAVFPFGLMDNHFLAKSRAPYVQITGERCVAVREGLTETIQYLKKELLGEPYYYRLITNNYSMSANDKTGRRYMKVFAYWPLAVHPSPKDALLICYGCGSTAKALVEDQELEHIEIVDTSSDIVEMSENIFSDRTENPVHDPRVTIHIEDGRFFLLTTERKFDIITAEPPPPAFSGVVNLYSQEYFQLIYDRLSEGGITTYWLPGYQLRPSETKSILKGFCSVFDNCSLWSGAGLEWMMVGMKKPLKALEEQHFSRLWDDPNVGLELRSLGLESPEQFGSLFIADGKRLHDWISESLPLKDNYPGRLSPVNRKWKDNLHVYRDFMGRESSRTNFMQSRTIKMYWPGRLHKTAEKYFAVRDTINEMLLPPTMRIIPSIINLHECIANPLLQGYILWAFGSDHKAQRIVGKAFTESENGKLDLSGSHHHLAGGAAHNGNYTLAEHYLDLASAANGGGYGFGTTVFRMYLLCLTGNERRAEEIGLGYINLDPQGKKERAQEITKYWTWIESAL
ncbi:MAG: spermidine synthase [Thermodesulfobacteriota bacterium]|nr:spermidine synthase [Thermodesulfobacteriota bacterium]